MRLVDLLETAIETKGFKRWFSGSKVVDRRGKPLLCFHGTHANQLIEPAGHQHFGTFTAANERIAELYQLIANNAHEVYSSHHQSQPAIYPVYLSIKNPLTLKDNGEWFDPDILMGMYEQGLIDLNTIEQFQNGDTNETWVDVVKRLGFDGLRYLNYHEDKGSYSWYPLKNHQVWNFFADHPYK